MSNVTHIDLLRHGETLAGACFLGSTDAVLSEQGWQQMHAAIIENNYQCIISSPLKRCLDFSQQLAEKHNLRLNIEDDLREIHFGDWEGRKVKDVWQAEEKRLSDFWKNPLEHTPPNAEALLAFQTRVNQVFTTIKNQHKGESVLMIVHAGVIRQIMANILSIPYKTAQQFNVDYAGLSRLECYEDCSSLVFINRLSIKK